MDNTTPQDDLARHFLIPEELSRMVAATIHHYLQQRESTPNSPPPPPSLYTSRQDE